MAKYTKVRKRYPHKYRKPRRGTPVKKLGWFQKAWWSYPKGYLRK